MILTWDKIVKLIGALLMIALYAIMIPVALIFVLTWYSVTWPWYLYRAGRRVAFPR